MRQAHRTQHEAVNRPNPAAAEEPSTAAAEAIPNGRHPHAPQNFAICVEVIIFSIRAFP